MARPILPALAIGCLTLVPAYGYAQSNITGTWELTLDTPQGANTVEVKVTQTGDALAGELITPLGNAPFKGTFIKNVLSVTAAVDVQGNAITLVFDGKMSGETLAGTVKLGDFGEMPWKGTRKGAGSAAAPAAAAPTAPAATTAVAPTTAGSGLLTGKWDIELDLPGNPIPLTGVFKQNGSAVTGTFSGAQGEFPVTGTLTGTTLKLEFAAPGGLNATMTGELKGDALGGKLVAAGLGEMDWTAKRAK
jgi:hypothetical protein